MILIVAGPKDVHARAVAELIARDGGEVTILDLSRFGRDAALSWPLGGGGHATPLAGGALLRLEEVRTVWYRRPRLSRIAEHVPDRDVRSFCREEWINLIEGMFLNSPARFVNPLLAEFAAVKPRQLQLARMAGLAVPDTLITSDPEAAAAFIDRHAGRVIHKALTAPRDRMLDTRVWDEKDRAALPALTLAPAIFQEAIAGPADIRATYIGGEILAARIETRSGRAGIDCRLDLDAPHVAHILPAEVADGLRRFMQSLGLVYGTIDLKVSDAGEHVFLEVNPQGQFLYVELLSGLPITAAMASYLAA